MDLEMDVFSLSGDLLATLLQPPAASVFDSKMRLAAHLGLPRQRQRLLAENGSSLHDDALIASLSKPLQITLIELPYIEDDSRSRELSNAVSSGDEQQVGTLLEASLDMHGPISPDASAPGYTSTPLGLAALRGHFAITRLLLEAGAAIDNGGNEPPLFFAAGKGHTEIVRQLCELNADINLVGKSGNTALGNAANCDRADIVSLLCEMRADVNGPQRHGTVPLQAALMRNNFRVAAALTRSGAAPLGRTQLRQLLLNNFPARDVADQIVYYRVMPATIFVTIVLLYPYASSKSAPVAFLEATLGVVPYVSAFVLYVKLRKFVLSATLSSKIPAYSLCLVLALQLCVLTAATLELSALLQFVDLYESASWDEVACALPFVVSSVAVFSATLFLVLCNVINLIRGRVVVDAPVWNDDSDSSSIFTDDEDDNYRGWNRLIALGVGAWLTLSVGVAMYLASLLQGWLHRRKSSANLVASVLLRASVCLVGVLLVCAGIWGIAPSQKLLPYATASCWRCYCCRARPRERQSPPTLSEALLPT